MTELNNLAQTAQTAEPDMTAGAVFGLFTCDESSAPPVSFVNSGAPISEPSIPGVPIPGVPIADAPVEGCADQYGDPRDPEEKRSRRTPQEIVDDLKREQEEELQRIHAKYGKKIADASRRVKTVAERREHALSLLDELRSIIRSGDASVSDDEADFRIRAIVERSVVPDESMAPSEPAMDFTPSAASLGASVD